MGRPALRGGRARSRQGGDAPDDAHRKDHIRALPTLEEIAQDIVGDAPDEGDDFVVRGYLRHGPKPVSRATFGLISSTRRWYLGGKHV